MKHYNIILRTVVIWGAITLTMLYAYIYIFVNPYTGLSLQPDKAGWRVQYVETCAEPCSIQVDDIVTRVADVTFSDTVKDRRLSFFGDYGAGDRLTIDVLREAREATITFEMPQPPDNLIWYRSIVLLFIIPFILWSLFAEYVLPKSRGQTLMVAAFVSYAAFIITGLLSPTLFAYSSLAVHALMWINMGIMIALHWELPVPMQSKFPHRRLFYSIIATLAVLELLQILPWRAYYLAVLMQVLICTALLIWRLAQGRAYRPSLIMLAGMWLAWLPGLLWLGSTSQDNAPDLIYTTFVIVLLLVWPFFYIYANYRPVLGKLEGLVRSAVIIIGFWGVVIVVLAVLFSVIGKFLFWMPEQIVQYTVGVSLLAIITAVFFSVFLKWVDKVFYGQLNSTLTKLNESLSAQLTQMVTKEHVCSYLVDEVARCLDIKQMTLYYQEDEEWVLFFNLGSTAPASPDGAHVCVSSAQYFPTGSEEGVFDWVRVSLPMIARGETKGYWLLGARHDDEYYSPRHVRMLQNITNGLVAVMEMNQQRASLQAQVDTIIAQERMAALGRLAASIAHQINNPLQIIIGALDAHSDFAEGGPTDKNLKLAYQKTIYLSDIVKSITAFVHPGQLTLDEVDVNMCVESAMPLLGERIKDNQVSVELKLGGRVPPVLLPRSDLPQVLTNLIENACDAMPDGGRLQVETSADLLSHMTVITVRDTGIGISPRQLPRLVEPFYTTKKNGTGFGLAIAYSIIERNNGRLLIESEPGKGSTFIIQLPSSEVTTRKVKNGDYFNSR